MQSRYGAASRYDFDNPDKWTTVTDIPVLDEHELDGEDGSAEAYVDGNVLQEIARNNNKRVLETGDPAPLIVGHTSDNPSDPEKKVVGYAVNYRVKPFRNGRNAIFVDYKVRKKHDNVVEDYPRRSVELWLSRKELDPIALLGGTTPERDLGVVIRNSRLKAIALLGGSTPKRDLGSTIHYSRTEGTVLRYSLDEEDDDMATPSKMSMNGSCAKGTMHEKMPKKMNMETHEEKAAGGIQNTPKGKSAGGTGMPHPKKVKYEAEEEMEDNEEGGGGDHGDMPEPDGDEGMNPRDMPPEGHDPMSEDPMIAKLMQSRGFQEMIAQTVTQVLEGLMAEEEGGDGMGGEPGAAPGGAPMEGAPPQGADGLAPQPDEEARIEHEPPPVKFGQSTGFGGPTSGFIPAEGGTMGKRYNRSSTNQPARSSSMNRTAAQTDPELVRLSRRSKAQEAQITELRLKLARSEAKETISSLQADGILFNDPEQEVELLATLDPEAREFHIESVIKKNYARAENNDPANPAIPGVARFARAEAGTPEADEEYEPVDVEEANNLANVQAKTGKSYGEVVKMMRARGALRNKR